MKVRGPLVTLGVVAVLGVGIWLVNISKQDGSPPGPATTQAAPAPTTQAAPAPVKTTQTPTPPPPPAFPAKADYVGEIVTSGGTITLDIAVDGTGGQAIAYGCDGSTVESWYRGSAANGVVSLANKDKTSQLDARLEGDRVVGTLAIGGKSYDFTTAAAPPPAGLYVYNEGGVRNTWVIDADGSVTGVQRQPDGSTSSAPSLSTDGVTVIDGRTVTATRVLGDTVL